MAFKKGREFLIKTPCHSNKAGKKALKREMKYGTVYDNKNQKVLVSVEYLQRSGRSMRMFHEECIRARENAVDGKAVLTAAVIDAIFYIEMAIRGGYLVNKGNLDEIFKLQNEVNSQRVQDMNYMRWVNIKLRALELSESSYLDLANWAKDLVCQMVGAELSLDDESMKEWTQNASSEKVFFG